MRERLILLAAAIALVTGLSPSRAQALEAKDPSSLIANLVSEAVAEMKQPQDSDEVRAAKFRALLEQGFDLPRISRFVLGRFWNTASDEERRRFTTLFENWVVRTYSARFRDYSGQTIKVTGTRPESDISTVVLSQFISPNAPQPARVEWHVRKEGDGSFKVVDVSVEGVSMALTQRDEIASVADRNGGTANGLNKALEQRLAQQ
ncbi:MAG TPA: ABC transporter substrate-binding protein [Stellaceae bacterium]|nr:ABC transporter substrate-binding protein [Stellaceae bacterium]